MASSARREGSWKAVQGQWRGEQAEERGRRALMVGCYGERAAPARYKAKEEED